jgi:uncharacterized membrane protein
MWILWLGSDARLAEQHTRRLRLNSTRLTIYVRNPAATSLENTALLVMLLTNTCLGLGVGLLVFKLCYYAAGT